MHHTMRRTDRLLSPDETWALLERGFCGRLGTAGPDGWPYVVPRHYVVHGGALYFHTTAAKGHARTNLETNPRVCFEVDEPGPVFPTGDGSPCQTSGAYESVVLFGTCCLVTGPEEKLTAVRALMAKYADPSWVRPEGAEHWPMLDTTAVWRIDIARMTGKRRPGPASTG